MRPFWSALAVLSLTIPALADEPLRIICFGAHPDDCELKAGGVAALWAAKGHKVKFVSVTNGDIGHWRESGPALARRRKDEVEAAAKVLGIETEVLDLRTLLPLDRDTILASVRRTGRLCVVHEDTLTMGLGAEVAALVCEAAFEELKAPPVRVAMADIGGIPVSDPMEDAAIPDRRRIGEAVRALARRAGGRLARGGGSAFDAAIPAAASVVEVALQADHLERLLNAVAEACRLFPACNAEFSWDGIREHPEVRLDLDLGSRSPARGDGTFTVVDYGAGSSLLGIPAVRPGQTATLRVGAVRDGRAWLALSVDHRAVDGAEAGRFLNCVKEGLER